MEISTQISSTMKPSIEEGHLVNIQNNIDIWEQYQSHPNIIQKKLIQTTSLLQKENINFFSFEIKIPSTYFAGVEEKYSFSFNVEDSFNQIKDSNIEKPIDKIQLNLNYHRVNSIYDMNIIDVIFNSLQDRLVHTDCESIEILTSLIVFEMENLSKYRKENLEISQEMFSIDNPHIKWLSKINIKSQFNDYSLHFANKYCH